MTTHSPALETKTILATEISAEDSAYFSSRLDGWTLKTCEGALDTWRGESGDIEVLSVMVHSPVKGEVFDRFPRLKLIATRSTGYDHIDLAEAAQRGIPVCNVPAYGSNTVAEHTFALILMLARKVHHAYARSQRGQFDLEGLMGIDLAGKTLGVIGAGKIGLHVIRIARGFGMRPIAFDPYEDWNLADLLVFDYVALDELLSRAEVIAVCCPLTESSRGLLNQAAFEKMKPGALLVNTARGGIVDSRALLWALGEGIVSAAGLDVLEGEALLDEDALLSAVQQGAEAEMRNIAENLLLMRHPNVVVTPHMAFYSREAVNRILTTTAENIRAYESGKLVNVVQVD
ncbi:MAG: hydroxyacid dehydrogenase [Fimbriimonadia bacterium]|nr:hydroxyacid dehydrogenase [Fimbriimonadia bacterium]